MPPIGFSCALKGSCCQQRGPAASTATTTDTLVPKTQTTSPTTPRFSAFFAEVVCTLGTTQPRTVISPSPNGGNSVIRTTTRRRHAHVVQTPTAASMEGVGGAGGPGRGVRGRRGLAEQRADAPATSATKAPPAWRAPAVTGGPGCGARRRRGQARQHTDTPTDWRPRGGRRSVGATNNKHKDRRPRAHQAARPKGRARRRTQHQRHHTQHPHNRPGTPKGRVPKYPPLVGSLSHCLVEA